MWCGRNATPLSNIIITKGELQKMERIVYRKTLDVHKNGTQFLLQGFETADNMSRIIEISLMASGDAIDFPLERMVAMMYVTTPGATEPSINECTIKDNKIVYEVLPIYIEGLTTMQVKLIETSVDGAKRVLASPKFAVEVTDSETDDESAEQTTTFTALEDAVAKAKSVYDERFLRMELDSECIFKAYYADGSVYETDILQKLFLNGNVLLSESYAHGGTGVRAGEDTDNSKYYSNVSKSEALKAKDIMENSEELLEEARLQGVYTAFGVDFETGDVEYVSPSFKFKVNVETGELDAEGQSYTFEDEIGRVVEEWLEKNDITLENLQKISITHTEQISALQESAEEHEADISGLKTLTEVHTADIGGLKTLTEEHTGDVLALKRLTDSHSNSIETLDAHASNTSNPHEVTAEQLGAPKIATGSYVGTGTCGMNNPKKIYIGFRPSILWIHSLSASTSQAYMYYPDHLTSEYVRHTRGSSDPDHYSKYSKDDKSVYIYSETIHSQQNIEGTTYKIVAIGTEE